MSNRVTDKISVSYVEVAKLSITTKRFLTVRYTGFFLPKAYQIQIKRNRSRGNTVDMRESTVSLLCIWTGMMPDP